MAKIQNAKPKNSSGAYERLFNNKKLGDLITKVHSTAISNGAELENIILQMIDNNSIILDCDKFLEEYKKASGSANQDIVKLIPKNVLKKSKKLKPQKNPNDKNFEPDFVILKIDAKQECCYIIELKDGFTFDTKKVIGERQHLELFENYIAKQIPYSTQIKFCCFNEDNKEKIKVGLKGAFGIEEIMTGQEFCDLIKINYKDVLELRKSNVAENLKYFVAELMCIEEVRSEVIKLLA